LTFRDPQLRHEEPMSSTIRFRGAAAGVAALAALILMEGCRLVERTDRGPRQEATQQAAPHRQIIQPEGVARLPVFSSAVRTGDLLFLSGNLGAKPGVSPPQLVEGGIEPETRQTMENIETVLAAAGLGLQDLVKCTVFLADMKDYAAMNSVYATFFPKDPPARSAIAGSGLALGARVEIECIAAYPAGH
jgi:2-iminobutanoate/2-iminopropanoate deaminase